MLYGESSLLAEEIFIVTIYGSEKERARLSRLIGFGALKHRLIADLCENIKKRLPD